MRARACRAYYAMGETPDAPPTIRQGLKPRREPEATCSKASLPEELLVALGAIQQWHPNSLWDKTWKVAEDPGLEQALSKHAKKFGELEPSDDQMVRFRSLAEGVTVR